MRRKISELAHYGSIIFFKHPIRTMPRNRKCKYPYCKQNLSVYNYDDSFCFVHQRMIDTYYSELEARQMKIYCKKTKEPTIIGFKEHWTKWLDKQKDKRLISKDLDEIRRIRSDNRQLEKEECLL